MKKRVADLSVEEFMKAFPIFVKEHNPEYKAWYESEKQSILHAVQDHDIARINHIGSSAVEGLIAKPTIDILLEVDGCCNLSQLVDDLKVIGYGDEILTRQENPLKLLLGKGYSVEGCAERVYHLHVRYMGNWSELYFRDYLIAHSDVATEYGDLKLRILEDIEKGIVERVPNGVPNGYSQAKLAFVEKHSEMAKQAFQNRYKPR